MCGSPKLAMVFKGLRPDPYKNGHRDKAAHVIYGFQWVLSQIFLGAQFGV
jgi:hypothetical protein